MLVEHQAEAGSEVKECRWNPLSVTHLKMHNDSQPCQCMALLTILSGCLLCSWGPPLLKPAYVTRYGAAWIRVTWSSLTCIRSL